MSESIPQPWIASYFVDVAETHGHSLTSAPSATSRKRAQLTKFLTFDDLKNETEPIWALISDKAHIVPVRLTSAAIKQYRLDPAFRDKSLTEHRTAMITIKDFRPAFGRVPQGGNRGMTTTEYLYLDVDSLSLVGSYDEDVWGSPKEANAHPQIKEWVEGLRQPGGGGNVLKLRKEQRNAQEKALGGNAEKWEAQQPLRLGSGKRVLGARKMIQPASPPKSNGAPMTMTRQASANPRKAYLTSWRYVHTREARKTCARAPPEILQRFHDALLNDDQISPALHLGDPISTEEAGPSAPPELLQSPIPPPQDYAPEIEIPEVDGRPTTPLHWSPSVRASSPAREFDPELRNEAAEGDEVDDRATIPSSSPVRRKMVDSTEDTLVEDDVPLRPSGISKPDFAEPPSLKNDSSSIPAPTPAQRPKPLALSSPAVVPETPAQIALPVSPAPGPHKPDLRPNTRRVPVPRARRISADPNVSTGRVLVPNSDTSGMASTQSQSQPQIQPLAQRDWNSQSRSQQSEIVPDPSYVQHHPQQRSQQSLSYTSGSQKQGQSQDLSQHSEVSHVAPTHHSLSYSSHFNGPSQDSRSQTESQRKVLSDAPVGDQPEPQEDAGETKGFVNGNQEQSDFPLPASQHGQVMAPTPPSHVQSGSDSITQDEEATELEHAASELPKDQAASSRCRSMHPVAQEECECDSSEEGAPRSGADERKVRKKYNARWSAKTKKTMVPPHIPTFRASRSPNVSLPAKPKHPLAEEEEESQSQPKLPAKLNLRHPLAEEEEESQTQTEPQPVFAISQQEESQTQSQDQSFQPVPPRRAGRRLVPLDEEDEPEENHEGELKSDEEDELESDDARTKAMVDSGLTETSSRGTKRKLSDALTSRHPSAAPSIARSDHRSTVRDLYSGISVHSDASHRTSGGPLRPSRPDVFFSDASLHASEDAVRRGESAEHPSSDVSAGDLKLNSQTSEPESAPVLHLPEAWRAPAFMLSRGQGKDKDKAEDGDIVQVVAKQLLNTQKRTIEDVSSPEEAPAKRLKAANEFVAVANNSEALSKPARAPELQPVMNEKHVILSIGKLDGAQTTRVKERSIDLLRAASAGSSTTSGKKQNAPRGGAASGASSFKTEDRTSGKVPSDSLAKPQVKHVNFERDSSAASEPRKRGKQPPMQPTVTQQASPAVGAVRPAEAQLLGGYSIDWTTRRTNDGPPLVTWLDLQDILLRTGRTRTANAARLQSKR